MGSYSELKDMPPLKQYQPAKATLKEVQTATSKPLLPSKEAKNQVNSKTVAVPLKLPSHGNGTEPCFVIVVLVGRRRLLARELLLSLTKAEYFQSNVGLHVHIDVQKHSIKGDAEFLRFLLNFSWPHGDKRIHYNGQHKGLVKQWLWSFPHSEPGVYPVFIEDDIIMSKDWFYWWRLAVLHYAQCSGLAGFTLSFQAGKIERSRKNDKKNCTFTTSCNFPRKDNMPFLYMLPGSHAFAPLPHVWHDFVEWFAVKSQLYREDK